MLAERLFPGVMGSQQQASPRPKKPKTTAPQRPFADFKVVCCCFTFYSSVLEGSPSLSEWGRLQCIGVQIFTLFTFPINYHGWGVGSSLNQGMNFWTLVCGTFLSSSSGVFSKFCSFVLFFFSKYFQSKRLKRNAVSTLSKVIAELFLLICFAKVCCVRFMLPCEYACYIQFAAQ